MKRITFILFIIFSVQFFYAQEFTLLQEPDLVTESNIYLDENNIKYSDLLTINFNGNIIDLPAGVSEATISDISDVDVKNYLTSLEIQYGNIILEKVFPDLIWGDTQRTNKRTGEPVTINDLSQVFQIHFSSLVPIEDIISSLSNYTAIEYAEGPYEVYKLSTEPNDPWYTSGEHWNLDSVFAKFAWDFTLGDTTITISINDFYNPNVTTLHEDLVDKVDYQRFNFAGGHGSQVASIAGVTTNNNLGIASLGWNLRLRLDEFYINGINAAIEGGADVINFSWLFQSSTLESAIHNALLQGIVCVAGAGNGGNRPFVAYPAAYNYGNDGQVIAVTATYLRPQDDDREHWYYWYNYSPGTDPILDPTNAFIDVSAPGVGVPVVSGQWSNFYHPESGTSFSSPLVAALAGLILSIDSTFTPAVVYNIITSTTDKIDPDGSYYYNYDENGWTPYVGYGRINAYDALNVASGAPHRPRDLVVSANALDEAQLDWNSIATEVDQYKIYKGYTAGEPPVYWYLVATIDAWGGFPNPIPVTSWTDVGTTVGSGPHRLWYQIVSVNDDSLESLPSDTDWIAWNKYGKKNSGNNNNTLSSDYSLEDNYPNPFNPSTTIKYTLKENGYVTLKVYDILGREVADLISEKQSAGSYNVTFNADGLVSGVYIYKLKVNDFIEAKKMILTK